jgi:hypothetical protein
MAAFRRACQADLRRKSGHAPYLPCCLFINLQGSVMSMFRTPISFGACVLWLGAVMAVSPALGQDEPKPQLRKLCMEDYRKHCAGVMPGGGAIVQCMLTNVEKLSPECRAGVEEWKKNKAKS